MSGSLTPYDKKTYRESKRRRKQAFKADKTGKIMPFQAKKRKTIVAIILAVVILAVSVCGYWAFSYFKSDDSNDVQSVSETEENELLKVVNQAQPVEQSYVPSLEHFDGFDVNALMLDPISEMFESADSEGIELKIINAYIPFDIQQQMYEQKLDTLLSNPDYTQVRAESEAKRTVPQGGCSEFQTGLLVDFDLSESHASQWLERNCVKYGFILRYPAGKEDVCNHFASDSIYRYVGKANALNMRSYNMVLEEYNSYIEVRENQ